MEKHSVVSRLSSWASVPARNKLFAIAVKSYAKEDIKDFGFSLIFRYFFNFFQTFCPWLFVKTDYYLKLLPDSLKIELFKMFDNFNAFLKMLMQI